MADDEFAAIVTVKYLLILELLMFKTIKQNSLLAGLNISRYHLMESCVR